jgi:DNA-binding NarL/FixJ family response regulator
VSAEQIRVVIADDDRFVTESLTTILGAEPDIEVVGAGDGAAEAVRLCRRLAPSVALLDIQMADSSGLDAGRAILGAGVPTRVVFLTTYVVDSYIAAALRMGASGYLVKQEVAAIAPALRTVVAGGSVFGDAVVGRIDVLMGSPDQGRPGAERLTEREAQIASLVALGLSNSEIAGRAGLSDGTVRNNISSALSKLALRSRTELAIWHLRGVPPPGA